MKQLGSDNCLQPDNIHYVMTVSFIEAVFEQTYVYGLAKSCCGFDFWLSSAHFLANYVEYCSTVICCDIVGTAQYR